MNDITILVAENSEVARRVITRAISGGLPEVELVVVEVSTIQAELPDACSAIVIGWNTPVLKAMEIVRAIRDRGDRVPVILITSEDEIDSDALRAAGVNDWLPRPIDDHTLKWKLELILRKGEG